MANNINPKKVGRFDAEVIDHDLGNTREGDEGTDFVQLRFSYNDADGGASQITTRLYLTPATLQSEFGPVSSLQALGWDPDEQKWDFNQLRRKTDENPKGGVLMGAKCSITTEIGEPYEGKVRLEVAWINEPGGGMKNRCEDGDAFSERVRKMASGQAPSKSATSSSGVAPDDDLPF